MDKEEKISLLRDVLTRLDDISSMVYSYEAYYRFSSVAENMLHPMNKLMQGIYDDESGLCIAPYEAAVVKFTSCYRNFITLIIRKLNELGLFGTDSEDAAVYYRVDISSYRESYDDIYTFEDISVEPDEKLRAAHVALFKKILSSAGWDTVLLDVDKENHVNLFRNTMEERGYQVDEEIYERLEGYFKHDEFDRVMILVSDQCYKESLLENAGANLIGDIFPFAVSKKEWSVIYCPYNSEVFYGYNGLEIKQGEHMFNLLYALYLKYLQLERGS